MCWNMERKPALKRLRPPNDSPQWGSLSIISPPMAYPVIARSWTTGNSSRLGRFGLVDFASRRATILKIVYLTLQGRLAQTGLESFPRGFWAVGFVIPFWRLVRARTKIWKSRSPMAGNVLVGGDSDWSAATTDQSRIQCRSHANCFCDIRFWEMVPKPINDSSSTS